MKHTKTINTFKSSNSINIITYYTYVPKEKIRGIVQISHGMCEYIERYEEFIKYLTDNLILVCGNDHLGHGKSVLNDNELGYMGKRKGWKYLVEDMHTTTVKVKEEYPDIPLYLFGHDMGSLVTRNYITKYGNEVDGVILSGTSDSNIFSWSGIFFVNMIKLFKGAKYRSRFLNNLVFNKYNIKYENSYSALSWLSKDKEVVTQFQNDPHCNFIFTASGFKDLFCLLNSVSQSESYKRVPKDFPIFLISGDMDPVGNYGKGVKSVFRKYKNNKTKDVSIKLYSSDRHEVLNETDKKQVYNDILKWLNESISNLKATKKY